MAICDFCNDECDGIRYPADTVKAAAVSGFRPRGAIATGDAVARNLGLSDFNMSDQWLAQVMADSSAWALCPSCAEALEAHLANAPAQPLPPAWPDAPPSRKRRWRLFGRE
ncbi:hypothetical protein [Kribbella sp. NPDC051770]|uniref:hypothetical protein n=1 Tax=Kribbella sp. NPDC051770 TaxID=3155413 RepID=UPI003422BE0C